jgi:integrase
MSINPRRHADGRTVYDVRLRDPKGRSYKRTFRTKKEAENFAAQERVEQGKGTWVDPREGRVLLAEYATVWLRSRTNLRTRTRELYEGELRLHILPALGSIEIAEISNAAVRSWYASLFDKGLAQSSCAKNYRLLRTILTTAVEDGIITKNPCAIKGAGVAKSPERPIATLEQVFALSDAIDRPYRTAVLLATFAGLRVGEILALTRERIDFKASSVLIVEQLQELKRGGYLVGPPKSDAGRRLVSLPDFMMGELVVHLAEHAEQGGDGRLFRGARGGPLRRAVLQRAWDEARLKVGVPHLHFHDLRHTGNTFAAATGASTRELMARMGHSSAEAALRYQHATRERDRSIATGLGAMASEADRKTASLRKAQFDGTGDDGSKVISLEDHRVARERAKTQPKARHARHGRATLDEATIEPPIDCADDQDLEESGRRESNPRSQLGKPPEANCVTW